jgi:hypothetical protein
MLTHESLTSRLQSLIHSHQHPYPHPDAAIFLAAARWALRFEPALTPEDLALISRTLDRAQHRLTAPLPTWHHKPGRTIRGFRSPLDGSIQPMGIVLPADYDPSKKYRLDCVLHGSMSPRALSYLRFLQSFDNGDEHETYRQALGLPAPAQNPWIEVHPLGRVENCYRWAGETDIFEAIAAAAQLHPIDPDKTVLRGFSMGASGTWHVGLKHPDCFAALAPYAGYVDTHVFSQTPLSNFVKVDQLPDHQEKALTLNDAINYAGNLRIVPTVAAIGAKDIFHDYAHPLMEKAAAAHGITLTNLVSPETGHTSDPVVWAEQFRQVALHTDRGVNHRPAHIRFVTRTLRYARCHWLQITGLQHHYQETIFEAGLTPTGTLNITELKNITRFTLAASAWPDSQITSLSILGAKIPLTLTPGASHISLALSPSGQWNQSLQAPAHPHKLPGLQGPIDDAFTTPFLCVRPTGEKPWHPGIQQYALAALARVQDEWARYWRADLPIKNAADLTPGDLAHKNLILFGDPGSNPYIARALPSLAHSGLTWTPDHITLAGQSAPSATHTPVLIHPSPFTPSDAASRYIVINSGHTFHDAELGKINYLLFPRLADWAILKPDPEKVALAQSNPRQPLDETVLAVGYCDENWQF